MPSQRENILAHFGTLLNGAGKPASVPTFTRSRVQAVEPSDLPVSTYFPELDEVRPAHRQHEGAPPKLNPRLPVLRWVDIIVATVVKAGSSTTADEELDPTTSWVVKAIVDGDWTGKAIGAQEVQTEFTPDVLDVGTFQADQTIRVYYTSRAGDPDVRS